MYRLPPLFFKALGKEQETSEEEMKNSTLAEEQENVKCPKGKQFKIISHVVVNSLLLYSVPINKFIIFIKVDSGKSRAVSIPGGRKRKSKLVK